MTTRIPVDKHRAWQVVRSAVYVCGESLKSCYYPIICAEDLRSRARVLPCNYILVIKKKSKACSFSRIRPSLSLVLSSLSFLLLCMCIPCCIFSKLANVTCCTLPDLLQWQEFNYYSAPSLLLFEGFSGYTCNRDVTVKMTSVLLLAVTALEIPVE